MSVLFVIAVQAAAQPPERKAPSLQSRLNVISRACHAPQEWLTDRGGEVIISASPDADFSKVSCVLKGVSKMVPTPTLGFIGNAQASEKK